MMHKKVVIAWPKENNAEKNPYNKILYSAMEDEFFVKEFKKKNNNLKACDILHIHWPDHMLRLVSSIKIRLRLWRFTRLVNKLHSYGGKVVWTVHNLQPHNISHPDLIDIGIKKLVELTDGFIFLSEASRISFLSLHPSVEKKLTVVIPHLHYKSYYEAQDNLAISKKKEVQLLCFGVLREHKGYKRLFDVAKDIKYYEQVGWLIAGNPGKQGVSSELEALWAKNQIIYKACRHINDSEIAALFEQSDAVVLPYESILNSGTAILALSLGKRVIAPAIGSLIELQESVGADWIHLYEQPIDKVKLEAAIEWVINTFPLSDEPDLEPMSPNNVAKETMNFYNSLLECEQ